MDSFVLFLIVFSFAGTLVCLVEIHFLKKLVRDLLNKRKDDEDDEYGDPADWWKRGNKDV